MVTSDWHSIYPNACLKNILAATSDHSPILLHYDPGNRSFRNRRFKFENIWLQEPDLDEVVCMGLSRGDPNSMLSKLECCADELSHWGARIRKRYREEIENCKTNMESLHDKFDQESVQQFNHLKEQLVDLILQEERFWKQRAKAHWLKDGDRNSKKFHAAATSRKKVNTIQ